MWWLVYAWMCGGLAVISRGGDRSALLLILSGLLAVQVWKLLPVGDLVWLCFAFSWVCVAGAIWRHSATISTLTLFSAMCYPVGRIGGFAFAPGDPVFVSPLFWADMALIAAILTAGGRGLVAIGANLGSALMGWYRRGSGGVSGPVVSLRPQEKGTGR